MLSVQEQRQMAQLLREQRWGALATVAQGAPQASMVAYAYDEANHGLLLHLSRLADHTRNLLRNPHASLVVSAPDDGRSDPQALPRLSLHGHCALLEKGSADYEQSRGRYLERLPTAQRLFEFGDFELLRLVPERARYIGGFARAHSLDREDFVNAMEA
ncbi:pyridoxamine 5'-phosphate oxidase family protein [Ectothiorhodospiraceae bacterium 2226]|nr:pyridoxamine 5'-phosphate oxidase family protein [Ectothiorhodospiraceae bacterium 2226]